MVGSVTTWRDHSLKVEAFLLTSSDRAMQRGLCIVFMFVHVIWTRGKRCLLNTDSSLERALYEFTLAKLVLRQWV